MGGRPFFHEKWLKSIFVIQRERYDYKFGVDDELKYECIQK